MLCESTPLKKIKRIKKTATKGQRLRKGRAQRGTVASIQTDLVGVKKTKEVEAIQAPARTRLRHSQRQRAN